MIRLANSKDLPILVYIAQSTFREKWTPIDGQKLVEQYITENMQVSHFETAMKDPKTTFLLFLEDNEPLGYARLNRAGLPIKDTNQTYQSLLQIDKLYVLEKAQNKKIGFALMNRIIEIAQEERLEAIWLGVWSKNIGAIRFYEGFGFEKIGDWTFRMGDVVSTDEWLMCKEI
jgi:ribosomal protein S18 acetylase RimI-like enzyme